MKLIKEIPNVISYLFPFRNGMFHSQTFNERHHEAYDLYFIENDNISLKYKGPFHCGWAMPNGFIVQAHNGSDLYYLDDNDNLQHLFEGEIYFSTASRSYRLKDSLVVVRKEKGEKRPYLIDANFNIRALKERYCTDTEHYWIASTPGWRNISVYSKVDESLLWSINIDRDIPPFDVRKNVLPTMNLFATETCIFLPVEGQLYAYALSDGTLKWQSNFEEKDKINGCDLYDGKIYAIRSNDLLEIDAETGQILQTKLYNNPNKIFKDYMVGIPYKVYDDYIMASNNVDYNLLIFDRKTLSLVESVYVGFMFSNYPQLHWINNTVYITSYSEFMLRLYR